MERISNYLASKLILHSCIRLVQAKQYDLYHFPRLTRQLTQVDLKGGQCTNIVTLTTETDLTGMAIKSGTGTSYPTQHRLEEGGK